MKSLKIDAIHENDELYDKKTKDTFLDTIKEDTRRSYRRIFSLTSNYEHMLNKDLNKFSLEEIEAILYSFKSDSRNTVESYARIMSSYLNWSVKKGLTTKNVLESLRPRDFEKYVSNHLEYLTNKNLVRIENLCANYQDAVILRLLFIGIGGREVSEIRNLKESDIDFESGKIKLIETLEYKDGSNKPLKYTERIVEVDSHTLKLIEGAINQKIYMKRNGEVNQTDIGNVRPYTDLVSNDYVIRASITRTDSIRMPVGKFVIYRRLRGLSEVLGIEPLNVKHIQRSGMINYANKLTNYGEHSVTLNDLKIIANRFNIKSHHNLGGFITDDNINKYNNRG